MTKTMFPWRQNTDAELLDEYRKLSQYTNSKDTDDWMSRSIVGYKCSNIFFQHERFNTATRGNKTAIQYWKDNRDYCISRREKDSHDLFGIVQHLCHAPNQFPPNVASRLYRLFNATSILDPFAGWGDRCVSAMSMGIPYTGIDSNVALKPCYQNMVNFYRPQSRVEMIYDKAENVDFKNIEYDMVLTSPPFWDERDKLFDMYNGMEAYDADLFIEIFLDVLARMSRNSKSSKTLWICIYIPQCMYEKLRTHIRRADKIIAFNCAGNKSSSAKNTKIIYCWETRSNPL